MDIRKELDAIIETSTNNLHDHVERELTKDKLNYTLFHLQTNISELTQCIKEITDALEKLEEAS
jgi:primosomal protein N''|tara:strand:- start:487 stop:678 length:192 start_codon:yes stop_codon:yes gene_type:complete